MTRSFLTSFFILFCTVLIESAILSNITVLPALPDLLLICVLYISCLNGKTAGVASGFVSGLLLDFISGAPLGFNCLFRTIIGYIAGFIGQSINFTGIIMPAVICGAGTLLKAILIWIIAHCYPGIFNAGLSVFNIEFLFEILFNIVLGPFIFKFLSLFRSTISLRPEDK